MASLLILFACGPVVASTPGSVAGPPRYEIDAKGRVVRVDAGGKIEWAARLDGKLAGKEPQLLWDAKRVYVRHNDCVTALAAQTGVVLWHEKGINGRLALSGQLLLSTYDRCVTARAVTTGAEVWRFQLPKGVMAALPQGNDWVFLGNKDVVRLSPGGKPRWRTPLGGIRGGGLVEVEKDVVAFLCSPASDSGVDVVRLNAASGRVVWQTRCDSLGVEHSQYSHDAAVTVAGGRLLVTSQGAYGRFVEELNLTTGKRLRRTERKD
jgi:outer membrane protein assembly factor BamB